jgi:uncharacterized protein YciI
MSFFVVTEERGPSWDAARPRRQQDEWDTHAAFVDGLVDDGFIVLGGPVGDGVRVLLVVEAGTERDVETRLAEDPWMTMGILRVATIEPWEILLDGRRVTRGQLG